MKPLTRLVSVHSTGLLPMMAPTLGLLKSFPLTQSLWQTCFFRGISIQAPNLNKSPPRDKMCACRCADGLDSRSLSVQVSGPRSWNFKSSAFLANRAPNIWSICQPKMWSAVSCFECRKDRTARLTFPNHRLSMTFGEAVMCVCVCVLEVSASDGAGRCCSRFGQ